VKVVCQDARTFRLEDHESDAVNAVGFARSPTANYFSESETVGGADLITMSYSLSMIVSLRLGPTSVLLTSTA
jgi:betaine lipid synthase